MTINKLHKLLGMLIAQGNGRKSVAINKATFNHPLESDGCILITVDRVDYGWYNILDDDGCTKINKDGSESGKMMLILKGEQ